MHNGDADQLKKVVAVLAACIVQTLNETDPSSQVRFLERLDRAYRELENGHGDVRHEMEALSWTRSLLTGFGFLDGEP